MSILVTVVVKDVFGNTNSDGTYPIQMDYNVSGPDANGIPANLVDPSDLYVPLTN